MLGLLLSACAISPPPPTPPLPDRETHDIFHADPRWLGGDAAVSVPLGGGRVLWLFGDSFVDLAAPYRRTEAAFPRNTVAIQSGADPRTAAMTFAWRAAADGTPASFFPDDGGEWFWPGGGARLDDGTLAVFLHRIGGTDAPPPLGFATRGYAVALIANPDDAPSAWRMRRIDGPPLLFDAVPGAAVLRVGRHVVVLAPRRDGSAATFIRFASDALARGDLGGAEWWAGARGWLKEDSLGAAGPAFVLTDAAPEASISWYSCARAYLYVASRGFGGTDIVMRRAAAVTGPWSAPQPIYRPPESDAPHPFVYAGKAHPELAAPADRGLAVTYVASGFAPDDLLTAEGERDLYWPRVAYARAPPCAGR